MKTDAEIARLNNLAFLAATLLDTGHGEAKEAALPIIELIKSQFQPDQQASTTAALQEWDGKGLPPVGTVCVFDPKMSKHEKWCWSNKLSPGMQVEVLAHYSCTRDEKLVAVFSYGSTGKGLSTAQAVAGCFRPIGEVACCNEEAAGPNPHYDPLAVAVEELRLARAEVDRLEAEHLKTLVAEGHAGDCLHEAQRLSRVASEKLDEAIKAANRA